MDDVYSFAIAPRDASNASGVVFRFMPDMRQVDAALDVRLLLKLHRNPILDPMPPYVYAEGLCADAVL